MSLRLFFFNDTATTEIYTLSLHDALPICPGRAREGALRRPGRGHARRDRARAPPLAPSRRADTERRQLRGQAAASLRAPGWSLRPRRPERDDGACGARALRPRRYRGDGLAGRQAPRRARRLRRGAGAPDERGVLR